MIVVGYIARRRCIGKNLAFAEIQKVEESVTLGIFGEEAAMDETTTTTATMTNSHVPTPPSGRLIQLIFQRKSPAWNKDMDKTFPNKNSKLPYGGKVAAEICTEDGRVVEPTDLEDQIINAEGVRQPSSFLVRQWKLLENPRENALAAARSLGGVDGISCTVYLKSRGDAFMRFNDNALRCQPKVKPQPSLSTTNKNSAEDQRVPSAEASPNKKEPLDFSHGDNRAKALRATIFASWLIATFGLEYLQSSGVDGNCGGGAILDIAGGKGKLSVELAIRGQIRCTIIDPLVRKHGGKLEPRDAKRIRKAQAPHPQLLPKPFNSTEFLQDDDNRRLVRDAKLCVGLHPDECTEDILDVALQHNKPVAVVPCCVFTRFLPLPTVKDPTTGAIVRVQTYEQFLDYLLAKDSRLQKKTLPFQGRNVVIYLPPEDRNS